MHISDVIIATASPAGRSLRGIVRVSGEQAFALLQPLLRLDECPRLDQRGAYVGRILLSDVNIPVNALVLIGPDSFTGEDSVEIQLPGNPILLDRVTDSLIRSGAERAIEVRRAEPGEFTARAFFNNRMTLTQAEGVAATIAACSDAELRASQLLLDGRLGEFAASLAEKLASALALVEAGIDFTDQEDVVAISPHDLANRLNDLLMWLDEQIGRCVGMEQLHAIPWVVITGPPNAGKSTLFNALLGRERAVVSHQPGTTRDILAEPLTIETAHGPAEAMLVDLAGIEETESELGRQMQAAACQAHERAELVLHCTPAGPAFDEGRCDIADRSEGVSSAPSIHVLTKADLIDRGDQPVEGEHRPIRVCAPAYRGLDELRTAIAQHLAHRAVSLASDAMALQPRHDAALGSARENLARAIGLIKPAIGEPALPDAELIASTMRSALNALADLSGEITPDDVLGRVFASFCVGK